MKVSEAFRKAGRLTGWDWTGLRDRMAPLGWSYRDLLVDHVSRSERTVDVGTGGGEVFSAAARPQDIAIDIDPERLALARIRLPCPLVKADHATLPFVAGSFDLVTDRHVGVTPTEVLRLLRPGGYYLTQQVGGHICQNIFDRLGWGSNEDFWRREFAADGIEYLDVASMAAHYEAAGCRVVRHEEAWVDYEFLDEESLAFWLANAPLPAIDLERDALTLDELPLVTNWHAHLLVVQAP